MFISNEKNSLVSIDKSLIFYCVEVPKRFSSLNKFRYNFCIMFMQNNFGLKLYRLAKPKYFKPGETGRTMVLPTPFLQLQENPEIRGS